MRTDPPDRRPAGLPLASAEGLGFAHPGHELLRGLSFDIVPGLTLVRGGEGRGKSTLLRLIAGTLRPTAGVVRRQVDSCFFENASDAASDDVPASTWLERRRALFVGWQEPVVAGLVEGFALAEHLHKPLYMLSTGSRRKVGIVAAAASGAPLTLIDAPFAALDGPSIRLLTRLLADAAEDPDRAWVIADHDWPAALDRVRWAGFVDLGD